MLEYKNIVSFSNVNMKYIISLREGGIKTFFKINKKTLIVKNILWEINPISPHIYTAEQLNIYLKLINVIKTGY